MDENRIREIIREELSNTLSGFVFPKHIQILDGRNIITGKTTGTKFPQSADQKWGAWGQTSVVQPAPSGQNGITANDGTAWLANSTSTGGSGSTAWRISEVIRALKDIGILQA